MKFKIIILLFSVIFILYAFFNNGTASEKIEIWSISNNEILAYETQNIDKSKYNPQGALDLIFAKHKKDTELFKKFQSANNYEEIKKMIYSNKKICFPKILIIKNKTAYINLEGDSDYISQRSGTSGAYYFTATVVFNLTQFNNIKYVYFILDEGDHFGPGKYERIDFWDLMDYSEKIKYKDMIEDRLNAKDEQVARYVELLQDIGDSKSINELNTLKYQLKQVGFAGCLMPKDDFEKLLNNTIKIIREKIKSKK